jgi:FlaA1/EpsC-like NDP-sugar epimerase
MAVANIAIEIIGVKPGEKLYEELMSFEEIRRSWELEPYFAVLPAFTCLYRNIDYSYPNIVSQSVTNPYHSGNELPMSKEKLSDFLKDNNLLIDDSEGARHPAERYWPNGSCNTDKLN